MHTTSEDRLSQSIDLADASLYGDGDFYDGLMRGQNDDDEVAFYMGAAPSACARILELGCGTGRLSLPLAAAGHEVWALDNSEAMLGTARAKANKLGLGVRFMHGDVRRFELDAKFDLVMFAHNSMAHLLTIDDVLDCMSRVRSHLAGTGHFVIDMSQPSPGQFYRDDQRRGPIFSVEDERGGRVEVWENSRYDGATQVHHRTWYVEESCRPVRRIEFRTRVFFPLELECLLRWSGFAIRDKFGSFSRSAYGSESEQQLLICTRA